MKKIVYISLLSYKKNAAYQRADSLMKSFNSLNYNTVLVGFSKSIKRNEYKKTILDSNNILYEVAYPNTFCEWIISMFDYKTFISIVNDIGIGNIETLVFADYRFIPMLNVKHFCERNGIKYVVDIQDWFSFKVPPTFNSLIKVVDNYLRYRIIYKKTKRRICISSNINEYLGFSEYSKVIPGTIDPKDYENLDKQYKKIDNNLTICFAGNPGKHCEKEKIDWLIKYAYQVKKSKRIIVLLAGVEKSEFIKNNKQVSAYLTDDVKFLGIIDHKKCLEMISKADFSIILRKDTPLTKFGFSTKFSESLACGTPIIATNTSDYHEYIVDGKNGFLCECSYNDFSNAMNKIIKLTNKEIETMHKYTLCNNRLIYNVFNESIREII